MARKLFLSVLLAVVGAAVSASVVSASGGLLGGGGDGGLLGGGSGGGGLLGGGGSGSSGGGGAVPPPPSTTPAPAPAPTGTTGPTGSTGSTTGGSTYSPSGSASAPGAGGHGQGYTGRRARRHGSAVSGTAGLQPPPAVRPNGVPTPTNPTATIAPFGPAPLGVSNFVIDQFEIPPFLLPIYQACGTQYGIPWPVLAGINKIETAFGTNVNISSAGAEGWMQFMPATWRTWGVDATGDGRADPYNPVDAICSAARYLKASGGQTDLRGAIFAYNHASWYVDEVLLYAKQYGRLPDGLVTSLTGLTEGHSFPVEAKARYADSPAGHATSIYTRQGAPVVAVDDGTIERVGHSRRLGNYVVLVDAYGNRFVYSGLGRLARSHPASGPKAPEVAKDARHPAAGHSAGHVRPVNTEDVSRRRFALPQRHDNVGRSLAIGQLTGPVAIPSPPEPDGGAVVDHGRHGMALRPLRRGAQVRSGTLLGRVGRPDPRLAPHLDFAILPAGGPRIDPKPILDGWKLLEATAIYRAAGQSPFTTAPSLVQTLLEPKRQLERQVLANPRLAIYRRGRAYIRAGRADQRLLVAMEYLAQDYRLTVGSLKSARGPEHGPGNVAKRTIGDGMDITAINGLPVGSGRGSHTVTTLLIQSALDLQGVLEPAQVISSQDLPGPVSFSLHNYADSVHVGFVPVAGTGYVSPFLSAVEGRIDMGVDFTGTGPIAAIGTARILATGAPGWPNGGAGPAGQGVLYQLLDGPHAGRVIYVYEGLRPTVQPGDEVVAGQQIGTFVPGSSIEIGFADKAGSPLSHAIYTEGMVTPWGRRMAAFLHSVGAPGRLEGRFTRLMQPKQWLSLAKRIANIRNPHVAPGPSPASLPAQAHGG